MDAIEFLSELKRACRSSDSCSMCVISTNNCLYMLDSGTNFSPEGLVAEVEEWSKAHPKVTNFDKLNELFPGVFCISNGLFMTTSSNIVEFMKEEYNPNSTE